MSELLHAKLVTRKRNSILGASEASTIARAKAKAEVLGGLGMLTEPQTWGLRDFEAEAGATKKKGRI